MNKQEAGFSPTPEWDLKERMQVAASLADKLKALADESHVVNRGTVYSVAERIEFVLTKPSSFLEVNRQSILQGQPPEDPRISA